MSSEHERALREEMRRYQADKAVRDRQEAVDRLKGAVVSRETEGGKGDRRRPQDPTGGQG